MADGQKQGLGCGVVVLALLGLGWLYQREGGKVFELPNKLQPPPAPLVLEGKEIGVRVKPGVFNHGIVLSNNTDHILTEATLTVTVVKKKGDQTERKGYWERWIPGEEKTIQVPASGTRLHGFSVVVSGKATTKAEDGRPREVAIAGLWEISR